MPIDCAIASDERAFAVSASDVTDDSSVSALDERTFGVAVTSTQAHAVTVSDSEE